VSLVSPDGARVPYPFPLPTPVNGQPPVTVSCSGLQGGGYPAGSTIVTCTATDALARQASCNFSITLTIPPKISKTKYLAFGDSITFGRCGPKEPLPNTCPPYTVRLEELLRQRYTSQTFTVITSGVGGERTYQGEERLPGELATYNPEVLLLMEGTNDVIADPYDLAKAVDSLEDMVDIASKGGVLVFLATIPPIAPGGPYDYARPRVLELNAEIHDIAFSKGAHLVDVFTALNANVPLYFPVDDLHPTGEGLRVIGETFYAKIRETLDITPPGSSSLMPSGTANLTSPWRRPGPIKRLPGK
jgi:lysophospholipase L1-like esterase